MKIGKTFLQILAVTALCTTLGATANAQETVRLAYLKTLSVVPIIYAQEEGYFDKEGINLEMTQVQTGPAAVSAIASGSVDIAFASPEIIIAARAQNLPYKLIIGLDWEKIPENTVSTILASKRSGVKSIKDLVGKTILMNAPGGACELRWHEWLTKNSIAWNQVKILTAPYPQTQAMLELGTVDAACGVEPFTTAIMKSRVDPVILAEGLLVDQSHRYLSDALFANDTWAQKNVKTIAAMKRALAKAASSLKNDPKKLREILVSKYRLPAESAKSIHINLDLALNIVPAEIQPILTAMEKYDMVKPGVKASDLIAETK